MSYLCTADSTGFPASFKLNLTATARTAGGCNVSGDAASTLVGDQIPTVVVRSNPVDAFCTLDGNVTATFNVTSSVDYTAESWTLTPEAFNLPVGANTPACVVSPTPPDELTELATISNSKLSPLLNRDQHDLYACWQPRDAIWHHAVLC